MLHRKHKMKMKLELRRRNPIDSCVMTLGWKGNARDADQVRHQMSPQRQGIGLHGHTGQRRVKTCMFRGGLHQPPAAA